MPTHATSLPLTDTSGSPEPPGPPANWRYSLQLFHSAQAPGIARSTVRTVLHEHELVPLTGTAELVTSELVTNSYRYADSEIFLRLRWDTAAGTLRISVWDACPAHPSAPDTTDPYRTRGRGLFLVGCLAYRWGVHDFTRDCRGKAVWVELKAG
ncbi:ATP-binding protein [Streptomyces iconiensis]|uniref:ATP-binding protein n=1 Tax=Streptomyces iconiensis TaxID=1384038 RepID=A0ABT7A0I4_9ACTN|nr:ATP-binding protein [Streptomyces iconiensis]MDJ1134841.1 ATP-binding protein [Streptomyces iconiensis]